MESLILRVPAAAQYIGVSVSTVNKWRCTGEGPAFVRLGPKAVGYSRDTLAQWVQSRSRSSTSEAV
jgi:predicted DNA-binding transcriptional regulator AlpA